MTNITRYPLQDGFLTNLAQQWDGNIGTMHLNTVPTFTFPSGFTTFLVIEPGNTGMQIAEIDSIDTVAKTANVSNVTLLKGAGVNSVSSIHPVNSEVIISDNYQFWADISTAVNSKLDNDGGNTTTTWDLQVGGSAFRIRKDGDDMKFTDDNNVEISLSTIAAAAGADRKVAISAGDTTPGDLESKLIAGDGVTLTKNNTGADENLELDVDLVTTNGLKITSGQLDIEPATNTQVGTQRIATDAEVEEGTLETVSLNPKQLNDITENLSTQYIGIDKYITFSASSNQQYIDTNTYSTPFNSDGFAGGVTVRNSGTVNVDFKGACSSSTGQGTFFIQKNGSDVGGSSLNIPQGSVAEQFYDSATLSVSVSTGDSIRIRMVEGINSSFVRCKDIKISFDRVINNDIS